MKRVIAFSLLLLFLVACSTKVQQTLTPSGIKTQAKGVAVLRPTGGEDEGKFAECVRDSISDTSQDLLVMSEKEFRDAMFPWYEPGTAPKNPMELAALVNRPVVKKRIEELGVRYVITVAGSTSSDFPDWWSELGYVGEKGIMPCTYGIVCMGIIWWERKTNISAIVWDLKEGVSPGDLGVEVTGKNVLPAFIVAFPFISPTETSTCNQIGKRLAEFIVGGGVQENLNGEPSDKNFPDEQ